MYFIKATSIDTLKSDMLLAGENLSPWFSQIATVIDAEAEVPEYTYSWAVNTPFFETLNFIYDWVGAIEGVEGVHVNALPKQNNVLDTNVFVSGTLLENPVTPVRVFV